MFILFVPSSSLPQAVMLISALTLLYFVLIEVLLCLQLGGWQTTYQGQVTAIPQWTTAADPTHNPLPSKGSQSKQYHSGCPQQGQGNSIHKENITHHYCHD
jgi:hypothetical protein